MDFIFRKLSVIFVGVLLAGFGYIKNKEQKKLDEECDKVIGKIVNYEEDDEGYGRYIYEYELNGKRYRSGMDKMIQKNKKTKVEAKFGRKELLYCDRKNPKKIAKVNDYTSLISILGGICIVIFAILFV
ncbi:MAG: hypothetical protein Q4D02_06790 [Clostridia bacterium]|nr:hypothetical protein [Clostridia bacterium]